MKNGVTGYHPSKNYQKYNCNNECDKEWRHIFSAHPLNKFERCKIDRAKMSI